MFNKMQALSFTFALSAILSGCGDKGTTEIQKPEETVVATEVVQEVSAPVPSETPKY